MRYLLTGATGFLGLHTRARLLVQPDAEVVTLSRTHWSPAALREAVRHTDVVLHLAGINRGTDDELLAGNLALADDLVAALESEEVTPVVVVAGSTYVDDDHPGRDSAYARGKRAAAAALSRWAQATPGARATEVRFPGLFGEHGRPDYNSFVATFAHRIARGEQLEITGDRSVPLLPAHDAVSALLDAAADPAAGALVRPEATSVHISEVARRLRHFHDTYAVSGDIPALTSSFDVALFNTLRAAMWPQAYPLRPRPRSDDRGTLVETVRVHGGTGQAFVSTTRPGYVRGDHVHFTKIERFQVLSGTGLIRLRRLFTDEVLEFVVNGDEPAVIDMPTLWTHSIENTGDTDLVTFFWSNELFDPERPDTYPIRVLDGPDRPAPARTTGAGS